MEEDNMSGDEMEEQDEHEEEVQNTADGAREIIEPNPISETTPDNRIKVMRKPSKQGRSKPRAESPPNPSRSLNHTQTKRTWRSANAFINFVQDFKKDYPDTVMGRNIFQICGERWKSMTDEQKQPYIAAANSVKRLKHRKIGEPSDHQAKKSVARVSKRKAETKRKETSQKRSKANNQAAKTNSDTDTATTAPSSMSDADSS